MEQGNRTDLLQTCLDRHYEEILNFMYLRIHNRSDAEDLTQDTFLRAVKSIKHFREEATLRTWIFSIARNVLADGYERKRKLRQLLDRIKQNLPFVRVEEDSTVHQALFSLLDQLREEDKELVIFKHYLGFSYEEISSMTGMSTSNVGVRLTRINRKLKKMAEGGEEHGLV